VNVQRTSEPGTRRPSRGKYVPKRKVCVFCVDNANLIDYKDPVKLRRFISDRGKIEPRRRTGTCARHQRALSLSIKKARILAMLPFVPAHIHETGGVGLRD
jgi:small subunit ribosomal protein S18